MIGTKTANWGYVLQDGLGSTRQLATHEGVIAMSVAYTPWGDVLAYYGNGGIDFGYLGGVYDENTGLIYMGNGRYYDPVTGRMLTRGAGQSNPYKPGAYDPAGMMVAPLAVLGLVLGKKKKRGKWDSLLVLLVVGMVVGMSVSACGPGKTTEVKITVTNSQGLENPQDYTVTIAPTSVPTNHIELTPTPEPPAWLNLNCKYITTQWGFGENENMFDNSIIDDAQKYYVPPWILKGLIARESSFDPYVVSGSSAYGLTQLTGNAIDIRWRFGSSQEVEEEIRRAMNFIGPGSFSSDIDQFINAQDWYNSLPDDENKFLLRSVTLNMVNGLCDSVNVNEGACIGEGTLAVEEIRRNIFWGALVLSVSRDEIRNTVNINPNWNSLSPEDQWKLILANYQSGVTGPSEYPSSCVSKAILSVAPSPPLWSNVKGEIENQGCSYSIEYAEDIVEYAMQGGD